MHFNSFVIRSIPVLFFLGLFISHFTGDEHYEYLSLPQEVLIQYAFGTFYFLCFIACLLPVYLLRQIPYFVWVFCSMALLANTLGAFIHAQYVPEQIVEHAIKIGLPIWFFMVIHEKIVLVHLTKVLIALTFIGHGVFALGLNYIPGNFISMTVTLLNVDSEKAEYFLFAVGLLDVIAAFAIFYTSFRKPALVYMIVWGFITALARAFYGFETSGSIDGVLYFIGNTVYRLPHGLIPLFYLILLHNRTNLSTSNSLR
jgi:hypothetical protein